VRLQLPEGGWADLRERLLYGAAREVRTVLAEARLVDLDLALVKAYVSDWAVTDPDGHSVPLDKPESAPDDVVQAIARDALKLWNADALPKATPEPSPSPLPEQR
jgi:hypothetical protein